MKNIKPLATRMRPTSISEVVGQEHLLSEGAMLNRMVNSKQIASIILYGPPGTGKTSIAQALSNDLNIPFKYFNASIDSKKELQSITIGVTPLYPAVVLIDEIHRLAKPNQDFLLSFIEDGSFVVVGATTENPYMSLTPALRSRSSIFELTPVDTQSILTILNRALTDKNKGLGDLNVKINDESLLHIAYKVNGDVRKALNVLELAVKSTQVNSDGEIEVTKEILNSCLQVRQIGGDKNGDTHYNLLSAYQKSIRGSDVDASLHYLARLIESGDLASVLRRLIVISYEDIGLADYNIHTEVLNAIKTAELVGLPEARIPLSYITIRLALSSKSNVAYTAIKSALNELNSNKSLDIPKSLHDTHYKGAKTLNKGEGYKYPHNYKYGITNQQYLPNDFINDKYLTFRDETDTKKIQEIYNNLNKLKNR